MNELDENKIPEHIAIIMDGNGRWAKKQGKARVFGHKSGVDSVRSVVEGAAEIGVKYLTLYAFSTENWKRPRMEINALMQLLVNSINKEKNTLMKNNIRLTAIGDIKSLPSSCCKELDSAMKKTGNNDGLNLILALSYSSKWEILNAVKELVEQVGKGDLSKEDINEELLRKHMCTTGIPDPELLIRTSGEHRISNFLLWQIAYSELYFTDKLWPEFRKEDLVEAIFDYQQRERRFGLISEQVSKNISD